MFVVFVALGFDVKCILVLNLQDMLSYLCLFLPYLILISLAWNLRREYLGLILLVGFARLVLRIVVAWGLFVLLGFVVLVVAAVLGMDRVQMRTVVAWGLFVALGFVVLVVAVVLGMGLVQMGMWSAEHLVVVVVLLF